MGVWGINGIDSIDIEDDKKNNNREVISLCQVSYIRRYKYGRFPPSCSDDLFYRFDCIEYQVNPVHMAHKNT